MTGLQLGDQAPTFTLPGVDGANHAYRDDAGTKATVVIFTCNHCPYALAWEDRILAVGADYRDSGVRILAINPNDDTIKPADSFENMKARVADSPWPIPYLRDESQQVAAAFGAKTTPDVFVFDAGDRLVYRGAPDEDYERPALNANWLRGAIEAVLAGETPNPAETTPVGCSVKWRA